MHHYDFHIGDFRSGCINLTRLERWIYRDLLDVCYDTEAPLPLDHAKIARLIGLRSEDEKAALEVVLEDKFDRTEVGYIQARVAQTLARYQARCEINARNKSTNRQRIDNESSTTLVKPVNQLTSKPVNQEPDLKPEKKEITQDQGVPSPQADIATTPFFEFARQMRRDLESEAKARGLNWVLPTDAGLRSWANQIRLAVVADGRTLDEIKVVWKWARQDSFWADNIRSAEKLRKQFDTLVLHKNKPKPSPSHTNPMQGGFAGAAAYARPRASPEPIIKLAPIPEYDPDFKYEVIYDASNG